MTHNTKRGLSILMALLLVLSMLTGIVLPASAETAQQAVDPYAKIEATADGDVLIPADNVYFYSPTFATAPEGVSDGDAFEYTYGDGAIWGNGKTYQLTWGVNTLATIGAVKSAIIAYNSAWSADPTSSSEDLVIVFAPGTSGYLNNFELKAAGGVADPTPDELMNLYLLGPQAGKSPVNAARDTKADAKEIQNDRSIDTTTEHTFTSTFWVPSYCDFYFDGFAATTACRLYNGYTYTNHYISNLYVQDLKTPAGHSIFCSLNGRQITWDFENCYFNMNVSMNNSDMAKATSESNDIYANKVIFNNCVFAEGKLSEKHPNNQTHHIKVWPLAADKASANFFGEYATAPLISVTNCVGVDWESAHLFRFPLNAAHYAGYNNNVVQIDITGNKFYDVGTVAATSDIFFLDKVSTADQADSFTLNISDNLFSFSDEVFGQGATGVAGVINANNALAKEGSTVITSKYKITVTDNIFRLPNNKNNSPFLGGNASTMVPIDVSGNLFVDNQNNILPAFLNGASPTSYGQTWVVQSDIYASDTMQGGVRELMTVREVENGTVLYSYITLQRRGNLCDFDYFTGALTLLLKRGVNYDANTLIKFNDPDVKFLGIYSEAACTNKVDTITQDTINGKYAKAEYKAGNTTLTVVYTLNTPRNYLIVDPTGAYADGYTFNGVTYKNGEKATDGVFAKFYTQIDNGSGNDVSAYAAATNPNTNDLLALGTQTFTDYDGQA